eukprot:jgi/Ulvmu1/7514/UM037_0058.1
MFSSVVSARPATAMAGSSRAVATFASRTPREQRKRKHMRLRQKVSGTEERPRLNVFRSNQHIYCQVIDDVHGHTLASASTAMASVKIELGDTSTGSVAAATAVGKQIAAACADKSISSVVFDRAGYKYHGRVQAIADAAREAGLNF